MGWASRRYGPLATNRGGGNGVIGSPPPSRNRAMKAQTLRARPVTGVCCAQPVRLELAGDRPAVEQHEPLRMRSLPVNPDQAVRWRQEPSPAELVDGQFPGRKSELQDLGVTGTAEPLAAQPHLDLG